MYVQITDPLPRLMRYQQRQVSKVLLDGLYDPDSPLYDLLGARLVVMNEVWQVLKKDWEFLIPVFR